MGSTILDKSWEFQVTTLLVIFLSRTFLFAGGSSLWIHFSKWAQTHLIVKPDRRSEIVSDILNGIKILIIDAVVVVAAIKIGLTKATENSSGLAVAVTFVLFFVWMEVYFYYSHRILHMPKLYWIHKHHHHNRATNPWTSLSFSVVERGVLLFGAVVIPGIFSQLAPMAIEGYSLYFLTNYILNVYGHLNVEFVPNRFVHSLAGKVMNTTTYHALHHARYKGHYGLFTSVLDRLHGTKFSDYEKVHAIEASPKLSALAVQN